MSQGRGLDGVLAPIRSSFDAAEAALDAAVEKLHAADTRLVAAQRRLDEAWEKVRGVKDQRDDRSS